RGHPVGRADPRRPTPGRPLRWPPGPAPPERRPAAPGGHGSRPPRALRPGRLPLAGRDAAGGRLPLRPAARGPRARLARRARGGLRPLDVPRDRADRDPPGAAERLRVPGEVGSTRKLTEVRETPAVTAKP